jgi:hypothetical protein
MVLPGGGALWRGALRPLRRELQLRALAVMAKTTALGSLPLCAALLYRGGS